MVELHRRGASFFKKSKRFERFYERATNFPALHQNKAVEFSRWRARIHFLTAVPGRGISKIPRSGDATSNRPGSGRMALASMR